jgi:hypothetical protein
VVDRSVGDGEFTEVVADHIWSDFDLVEGLTVVDTDDGTNHLWDDNHVTQMGLDDGWSLVLAGLSLGLTELSDEAHWLSVHTTLELSSSTGVHHVVEVLEGKVEQILEVNASVGKLLEGSLSWLVLSRVSHVVDVNVTKCLFKTLSFLSISQARVRWDHTFPKLHPAQYPV